ncbi:MAG: hypothetical protein IPJ81_09010 [Chitinophagaceae bacterium]|nr:hypothetical protein [Chitinophagaceae bacterium]
MPYFVQIQKVENVDLNSAKFLFYQTEKMLEETIKIADIITTRSYSLLTIILGLIVGIASFTINKLSLSNTYINSQTICLLFTIIYLITCMYFLVKLIYPKKYYSLGSPPQELCIDKFFIDNIKENLRVIYLYVNEIENYKNRIDINLKINERRQLIFKSCIFSISILPILIILIYIILLAIF